MRPPKLPIIDGKKQCSKRGQSKPHILEFFTVSHKSHLCGGTVVLSMQGVLRLGCSLAKDDVGLMAQAFCI